MTQSCYNSFGTGLLVQIILAVVLLLFLSRILQLELMFYKNRNWNYSLDSGRFIFLAIDLSSGPLPLQIGQSKVIILTSALAACCWWLVLQIKVGLSFVATCV